MAKTKGFSSGPRFSPGWWFGKNSYWAQSGVKEYLTGAKENGDEKGWFEGLGITIEHDIPEDQKLIVYGVIGLIIYQLFIK